MMEGRIASRLGPILKAAGKATKARLVMQLDRIGDEVHATVRCPAVCGKGRELWAGCLSAREDLLIDTWEADPAQSIVAWVERAKAAPSAERASALGIAEGCFDLP